MANESTIGTTGLRFNILNEFENNYLKTEVLDLKLQGELSYRLNNNIEVKGLATIRHAVPKVRIL